MNLETIRFFSSTFHRRDNQTVLALPIVIGDIEITRKAISPMIQVELKVFYLNLPVQISQSLVFEEIELSIWNSVHTKRYQKKPLGFLKRGLCVPI